MVGTSPNVSIKKCYIKSQSQVQVPVLFRQDTQVQVYFIRMHLHLKRETFPKTYLNGFCYNKAFRQPRNISGSTTLFLIVNINNNNNNCALQGYCESASVLRHWKLLQQPFMYIKKSAVVVQYRK